MPPTAIVPQKKSSKWTWFWIVICVLVFFSPVILYVGYSINKKITKAQVLDSYLERKYNKQFDVKNVRFEDGGLGMPGQPTADAYPIDNKDMKFEVGETGSDSPIKKYYDTYIEVRWTKEATQDATPAVRSIFNGNMPWLEVEAHPINKETGRRDKTSSLYNNLPTLKAQMEKDPTVVYYNLSVRTSGTLDASNKAEHVRRIHELAKLVSKFPSGDGSVRYTINHPTQDSSYYCQINSRASRPFVYSEIASSIDGCFHKNVREY